MTLAPTLFLSDGSQIPQIGLGTWPMNDAELTEVVPVAIEVGYRHFDSAVNYGNETGLGEGIRRSGIDRSEVFVTTKVPGRAHGYDSTKRSLAESLDRLGMTYVDLLLIHWPNPNDGKFVETFQAMVDLQKDGLAKSVGVSNFTVAHLQAVIDATGTAPSVNQVQLFPGVNREEQRAFHEEHGIVTESWSPLGLGATTQYYAGNRSFLEQPAIVAIAQRLGVTAAQVVLRWHVQQGLVPLPKSSNVERLRQNLDVFSFSLTGDDIAALSAIDSGAEVADPETNYEY